MTTSKTQALQQISRLFDSQRLAVLSTVNQDQPHTSLVAFAASPDLAHIYLLTPKTTRKYDNLTANPRVSMLINDSRNKTEDLYAAVAVTVTGRARPIDKTRHRQKLDLYLDRHPQLGEFSRAMTTAFIQVAIDRYDLVSRFQNVVKIRMAP
jgi:nitroimidazol reductase NimA-like FMN-containing flavoprotein (pyridoxamine 5'-phosphate oxidase superfamily)